MEILKNESLDEKKYEGYKMISIKLMQEENLVKFGKAIIEPNVRLPLNHANSHEEDEYSYIIKGCLECGTETETYTIKEGEFSFIPKGEKHWCKNNEDTNCELVWFLLKR